MWEGLETVIYRFVNSRGAIRHGLIVEQRPAGIYVLQDDFRWKGGDDVLPANYAYISLEKNPFVDPSVETKSEILPVNTEVRWSNPRIAEAHRVMKSGGFTEWWKENADDVKTQLAKRE